MSRGLGPACRKCRREGIKLMLKGVRCQTAKCPMEREARNKPPGMHVHRRGTRSEYGVRLREKQKVKRYYGVTERQFRLLFGEAERSNENTGLALLQLLERRLDNVMLKSGLAPSRKWARQAISHGHVYLAGRKMDRSGYLVRSGDKITVSPREKSAAYLRAGIELAGGSRSQPVAWLETDMNKLETVVTGMPSRDDVQIPVEEHLIVEFCSR
ncbi:MAG: 30S ribosomal protein S4 [Phycisphaerae bacterium]|nr:30S ribosomal protein S4 [Phycisphaerae bacterium]